MIIYASGQIIPLISGRSVPGWQKKPECHRPSANTVRARFEP